jgi:hypothetical protein
VHRTSLFEDAKVMAYSREMIARSFKLLADSAGLTMPPYPGRDRSDVATVAKTDEKLIRNKAC